MDATAIAIYHKTHFALLPFAEKRYLSDFTTSLKKRHQLKHQLRCHNAHELRLAWRYNRMGDHTVRTTLTLPMELLEAADKAVQLGKVKSRNEFVAQALRREIAAQKRQQIDAALAKMANDPDYQAEAQQIEAEFAETQWEAWRYADSGE